MKKSNKKGFTIVELVIVIAVIAILAAVLIPTFSNVIKKANESAALQAGRNAYTEIMAATTANLGVLGDAAISSSTTAGTNGAAPTQATLNAVKPILAQYDIDSVQYTAATDDDDATLVFIIGDYTVTGTLTGQNTGWVAAETTNG